jgi:hypothetical protein
MGHRSHLMTVTEETRRVSRKVSPEPGSGLPLPSGVEDQGMIEQLNGIWGPSALPFALILGLFTNGEEGHTRGDRMRPTGG